MCFMMMTQNQIDAHCVVAVSFTDNIIDFCE